MDCPECQLRIEADPEDADVYCPWCGARNPECFELFAFAELQALEAIVELEGPAAAGRRLRFPPE